MEPYRLCEKNFFAENSVFVGTTIQSRTAYEYYFALLFEEITDPIHKNVRYTSSIIGFGFKNQSTNWVALE